LTKNLTRPFEILNGTDFSLSHSEDVNYSKTRCRVRPYILIMVSVEGFAPGKDNLCPFHSHYAILEVVV
jgi:hypothetical protein